MTTDEQGEIPKTIDIDSFLQTENICELGVTPESDAKAGYFNTDSEIFAVLGGKEFWHKDTRTILFNSDGTVTVTETAASFSCDNGATFGRDSTGGGDAVSRAHAYIWRQKNKFLIEDAGSTNGTVLFKAEKVPTNGATLETQTEALSVDLSKEKDYANYLISFGKSSIVRVTKTPDGDFMLFDAAAPRKNYAQRLRMYKDGDAVTIGGMEGVFPQHLRGDKMHLPDEGLDPAHVRILFKSNKMYILNTLGENIGVAKVITEYEKSQKAQEKQKEQAPPQQTPPNQEQPKQKTYNQPKKETPRQEQPKPRTPTINLWQTLEHEIDVEIKSAGSEKAAYRKLALKYHPDYNRNDPDADRRMMLINKHFGL